tara:strand:+ start:2373 stop:3134 length:762 start_codon:yes stop_codon:yes gene_type:complete
MTETINFLKKWGREELLTSLDEFHKLYLTKPITDNNGGMKSPHMFPAWFIIKQLKPKYLIESGVWKGLGTWFFEQASPDTKIISIDPVPQYRQYTSPKVTYQTEDFLKTDWSHLPKDETVIFFDDHQNFYERLKHAYSLGFKKIMTEDNYPYQQGDCYTPKKILANRDYVIDVNGTRTWHKKNDSDLDYFRENVLTYQEMPPIYKDTITRWGDDWDDKYPTPDPLLTTNDNEKYPVFFNEKKDYTWICYLELN